MPKPISVLFVATEADPFIKTGSIGDLAGSIPKTVKSFGHDIRVMLPGYSSINNRRFQIHNLLRMKDIQIPLGTTMEHASIKSSYLNSENQKVLVYFLANDRFFNREGLYFHPLTKKYFTDNDERFIFFCRGVLETLKRLRWQPDIIHCNDWQCGLIPAYLKSTYKNDPFFKNVRTVFTVYSLASHGTFPKSSHEKTGIPEGWLGENGSDKLNFLKAGLSHADVITTFGSKAEKGICLAPQDDMGKILNTRKNYIVSMTNGSHNGSSHNGLAEKFIDVYRDLTKNG
jgi:starch synthase